MPCVTGSREVSSKPTLTVRPASNASKPKVRELYRWLASQRLLINIQPGTTVDVASYGGDGIAMISIGGTTGYIARADLTMYLGNFEE